MIKPWGYALPPRSGMSSPPGFDARGSILDRVVDLSPSLAKGERGGVIAPNPAIEILADGAFTTRGGGSIDPGFLRTAMLFADKIDIPRNSAYWFDIAELRDLEAVSIGARSNVKFEGGVGPEVIFTYPWISYLELDKREPGRWSIWQQPDQQIVPQDQLTPELGFNIKLNNTLLVPHRDLPFEDVISFKERHKDELLDLHTFLLKLTVKVSKESDPRAIEMELEEFDISLSRYLKKARESNIRKAIASLTVEMDWSAAIRDGILGGSGAGLLSAVGGLSLGTSAAAIGGGILTTISVKSASGLRKPQPDPFRYIARVEQEFGV